jgi:hypothetical protein
MSWRKLATGSGSTCVVIVDNDVSGAIENMIALCALLSPSLPDESV